MKIIKLDDLKKVEDYRVYNSDNYKVVFTTAEKDRSFNRWTEDGIDNLNSIKKDFGVNEVIYIKQIHSDIAHCYKKDIEKFIDLEGDAIITDESNTAVGVFTADCVPIVLLIKSIGIGAVIHSGWKGTFNSIVKKTLLKINEMKKYNMSEVEVIIGPHIRQCCYEVSNELKDKFIEKKKNVNNLFNDRNLSLESFIIDDLKEIGINNENIISINECTHCSTETKLHSYRKSAGDYGRLFTFIVKNEEVK